MFLRNAGTFLITLDQVQTFKTHTTFPFRQEYSLRPAQKNRPKEMTTVGTKTVMWHVRTSTYSSSEQLCSWKEFWRQNFEKRVVSPIIQWLSSVVTFAKERRTKQFRNQTFYCMKQKEYSMNMAFLPNEFCKQQQRYKYFLGLPLSLCSFNPLDL